MADGVHAREGDAKTEKRKPLSPKHRQFVDAYLECFNATDAYLRVYGDKHRDVAAAAASRLLGNVKIAEAIDERLSEDAMRATEVLQRLGAQARADLGEFITDRGEIDLVAMRERQATGLIKKFKRTVRSGVSPNGAEWSEEYVEVDLHDAQAALVHLGRHHGLFDKSPTGAADDPVHVKVIEGPKDVR